MRQHFHRCTHLRVVSVDASVLSGDRGHSSAILDELGGERGQEIVQLARDLLAEREEIIEENRRLLTEAAAAENRRGRIDAGRLSAHEASVCPRVEIGLA